MSTARTLNLIKDGVHAGFQTGLSIAIYNNASNLKPLDSWMVHTINAYAISAGLLQMLEGIYLWNEVKNKKNMAVKIGARIHIIGGMLSVTIGLLNTFINTFIGPSYARFIVEFSTLLFGNVLGDIFSHTKPGASESTAIIIAGKGVSAFCTANSLIWINDASISRSIVPLSSYNLGFAGLIATVSFFKNLHDFTSKKNQTEIELIELQQKRRVQSG
jgi:hypothetical protein